MRIDLNADIGESFGAYTIGDDAALMPWITSANIAAGFHAGDPSILRRTIRLAREHGVAIGAHPGFPDLIGFGRREIAVSPADTEDLVLYQIAAVAGVAAAEGVPLRHVKPHGALFNMAARDADLAAAVARATAAFDARLILFGLAGSQLLEQGRKAGLRVAAEVFADRAYQPDGSLVSRDRVGAVLDDDTEVAARAVRMISRGTVVAIDGSEIEVTADTICLHGDAPGAGARAGRLRRGLEAAGIRVLAPSAG
jgi:5-oxoprolinase (ATP-hydrolysing) subunit A